MLRHSTGRFVALWPCGFNFVIASIHSSNGMLSRRSKHHRRETEAEFNQRYVDNFLRWDIDGWEIRQEMNNLLGMDLVPAPNVIEAGLRACRQVNDIALAIRWLEGVKNKCGDKVDVIYPYLMENIRPTLIELGVPTLEELNYHEPQLALERVEDM